MTWKLKTCPRCQGDLFLDKDIDGWYEQCLQCGFRKGLRPIAETRRGLAAPEAERLPTSGVETPEKRRTKTGSTQKGES